MGVNPRGLKSQTLWKMDMTHISKFERLAYMHVTINTFSRAIHATSRTGETIKDVTQHLLTSFKVLKKNKNKKG